MSDVKDVGLSGISVVALGADACVVSPEATAADVPEETSHGFVLGVDMWFVLELSIQLFFFALVTCVCT